MSLAPAAADRKPSPARDWLVVLILLAVATLASYLLDPYVSLTSQAMLYVLAVVVASYTLPWAPSLACAFAAVSAFNFFFVPPRWTFEVENRELLIALFTMLALALVISHLGTALRRKTEVARLNETRARQLQELATGLVGCTQPDEVLALGRQALAQAFPGPAVLAAAHGKTASWRCRPSCLPRSRTACCAACVRRLPWARAPAAGPAWTPGTSRWERRAR